MKLEELYETLELAHDNFSYWLKVCDLMADFFGGVGAAIIPVDKNARLPWLIHSKSLRKLTSIYIKDEWYLNDVRENGLVYARQKGFTSDLDFITEDKMVVTPYYRDFLRPNGIGGFLAILFKVEEEEWVISIQFPFGTLSPKEELLGFISEIKNKVEIAALTSLDNLKQRISQIVSDATLFEHGVVLLDANNNVTYISDLAKQMLKNNNISINNGSFLNTGIKEKVKEVLNAYQGGALINEVHALARGEQLDLFCKISNLPEELRIFNSSAVSIIILVEAKSHNLRQYNLLTHHYGLTKTESLLVIKLVEGVKLKDAATFLNISEGNARQHLKKIFRKIDVSAQTELIVKILRECTMIDNR